MKAVRSITILEAIVIALYSYVITIVVLSRDGCCCHVILSNKYDSSELCPQTYT